MLSEWRPLGCPPLGGQPNLGVAPNQERPWRWPTNRASSSPLAIGHSHPITTDVVLVSGIAKNAPLEREVAKRYKIHRHFKFPDHHAYTAADIESIHQTADLCNVDSILTTEKDMVKLIGSSLFDSVKKKNWFYVPIQATFIKNGSDFDTMIFHLIEDKLKEVALA